MIASNERDVYNRIRPTPLPTLELADVVRLLPRLRCGFCGSRVALHPPERCSLDRSACICERGYLYCQGCARVWNDVAHQARPRVPLRPEEMRPKRGRRPGGAMCSDCGVCSSCRTRRWRAGKAVTR